MKLREKFKMDKETDEIIQAVLNGYTVTSFHFKGEKPVNVFTKK